MSQIIIKKGAATQDSYVLWIGDQQYSMGHEDLLNLQHCLSETFDKGEEASPTSHFRLLNAFQYTEFHTEGRATLWVGERKWHIRDEEEKKLRANVVELLTEG